MLLKARNRSCERCKLRLLEIELVPCDLTGDIAANLFAQGHLLLVLYSKIGTATRSARFPDSTIVNLFYNRLCSTIVACVFL